MTLTIILFKAHLDFERIYDVDAWLAKLVQGGYMYPP